MNKVGWKVSKNRGILNILKREYISLYKLLYENKYIIEHRELKINSIGKEEFDITWSGRNSEANITFDLNLEIKDIFDVLLKEEQFSMLFYDKSILQVEYKIKSDKIIKQRLQFIKKSSKVRSIEELQLKENTQTEIEGSDWFEEEIGIPVFLRIDYDPENHKEIIHSKAHFVISNLKDCRIPMKSNLSLSKFIELILQQIYNEYSLKISEIKSYETEITKDEKNCLHLNW
jgi:hypothetical protein